MSQLHVLKVANVVAMSQKACAETFEVPKFSSGGPHTVHSPTGQRGIKGFEKFLLDNRHGRGGLFT